MPRYNPTTEAIPSPDPAVQPVIIETASVYNNIATNNNVIAYIEGDTWVIDYFNQHYGDEDVGTTNYDVNDPTLKQYTRTKKFELRVTDMLSQTTDETTGNTMITGGANVYPVITPSVGDVFIGQVGDNLYAMFTVTEAERLSHFKESVFSIRYTLTSYLTDELLADLEAKTVAVFHFDLKGMMGRKPALRTQTEYERDIERVQLRKSLIEEYFVTFYRTKQRTFLLPDSETLDPFLVEFWNRMIGTSDLSGFDAPMSYNLRNAIYKTPYKTLWDAIADQSMATLRFCVKSMLQVSTSTFGVSYLYHTLESTSINGVIQPTEVNGLVISNFDSQQAVDSPYVFSQAFYEGDVANMTNLENIVYRSLEGVNVFPYGDIKVLVDATLASTALDRFYHLPILITLLGITR